MQKAARCSFLGLGLAIVLVANGCGGDSGGGGGGRGGSVGRGGSAGRGGAGGAAGRGGAGGTAGAAGSAAGAGGAAGVAGSAAGAGGAAGAAGSAAGAGGAGGMAGAAGRGGSGGAAGAAGAAGSAGAAGAAGRGGSGGTAGAAGGTAGAAGGTAGAAGGTAGAAGGAAGAAGGAAGAAGGTAGAAGGAAGQGGTGGLAVCGTNSNPSSGLTCNALDATGPCVTPTRSTGTPPTPTGGGQIAAGTYDLTSTTIFASGDGGNNDEDPRRETVFVVGDGTVQTAHASGTNVERQNGTASVAGTQLTFTPTCPAPGDGGSNNGGGTFGYNVTATTFSIIEPANGGGTRVSVYTRRN